MGLICTCLIVEGLLEEVEVTLQAEGGACVKAAPSEWVCNRRNTICQEFSKPGKSQKMRLQRSLVSDTPQILDHCWDFSQISRCFPKSGWSWGQAWHLGAGFFRALCCRTPSCLWCWSPLGSPGSPGSLGFTFVLVACRHYLPSYQLIHPPAGQAVQAATTAAPSRRWGEIWVVRPELAPFKWWHLGLHAPAAQRWNRCVGPTQSAESGPRWQQSSSARDFWSQLWAQLFVYSW